MLRRKRSLLPHQQERKDLQAKLMKKAKQGDADSIRELRADFQMRVYTTAEIEQFTG